jgi:hypothetical protein
VELQSIKIIFVSAQQKRKNLKYLSVTVVIIPLSLKMLSVLNAMEVTNMENKEKIDEFIKNFKGTRDELNKALKRVFKVQLSYPGKYSPHIGLKQRLKALMKTGLTRDQALDKLAEMEGV